MIKNKSYSVSTVLSAVSFLIMIVVNALANIIPINGVGTGEVSDSYPNLFAPAGYTFAIWGLIYLLLAGYVLYQLGFFRTDNNSLRLALINKINPYFILSSIANTLWIFSWHYYNIGLSMLFMIVILLCLIIINIEINNSELFKNAKLKDKLFIKLPFSVYYGWITVATIANATTYLVSIGWNGFGISDAIWTVLIITVGLIISVANILKYNDIAYGLVIIWAYVGILVKHVAESGFAGQYPSIIAAVSIAVAVLIVAEIYVLLYDKK